MEMSQIVEGDESRWEVASGSGIEIGKAEYRGRSSDNNIFSVYYLQKIRCSDFKKKCGIGFRRAKEYQLEDNILKGRFFFKA